VRPAGWLRRLLNSPFSRISPAANRPTHGLAPIAHFTLGICRNRICRLVGEAPEFQDRRESFRSQIPWRPGRTAGWCENQTRHVATAVEEQCSIAKRSGRTTEGGVDLVSAFSRIGHADRRHHWLSGIWPIGYRRQKLTMTPGRRCPERGHDTRSRIGNQRGHIILHIDGNDVGD
jgi:hypothetical protein